MKMVPYLTGTTSNIYDADELRTVPWNAAYPHVPVLGLSSVSQQLPITTNTNIQHPSSKPVRALKLPEPDKKSAGPAVNTAPIIKTQLAAVSVGFEVTPVAARKNTDRPTGRVNKFANAQFEFRSQLCNPGKHGVDFLRIFFFYCDGNTTLFKFFPVIRGFFVLLFN